MPFTPEQTSSGRWRGGFLHPVTGRKVRKTFDYAYEAEAWSMTEEQRARAAAADPVRDTDEPRPRHRPKIVKMVTGPTVAEYGAEYLERRRGLIAKSTRAKYRAAYNGFRRPYGQTGVIADRHMTSIKNRDVEQWMTDQVAAGVGHVTINSRLTFLRRLYTDMMTNDPTVERNPTVGIKSLPIDVPEDRVLTPAEDDALLAAADPVHRVAFMVSLDAGLRWQETYALRVHNLVRNADGGVDYIRITGVLERDEAAIRPWPKGKEPRTPVPTTDRLSTALADLVEGKEPGDLLFPNRKGEPWKYSNHRKQVWMPALYEIGEAERVYIPTKFMHQTGPKAGTPYMQVQFGNPAFGFHQLRHTYGSRLSAAGVPRSVIAELMGHSDERTTKRYIHTGDDGRRLAMVRESLTA